MGADAAALKERLARVGRVKQESAAEDARLHLGRPPGERLAATLRHCDAQLVAFAERSLSDLDADADARVWPAMRRRLAGHR